MLLPGNFLALCAVGNIFSARNFSGSFAIFTGRFFENFIGSLVWHFSEKKIVKRKAHLKRKEDIKI